VDNLVDQRRLDLEGEYDLTRRPEVESLFATVTGPVVLDFSKVTYVDSLFLQELIRLRDRLERGAVTLMNLDANVSRLFEVMGIGRLFKIV
jgi:anti-anti-sigma factor